MQFVQLACAPFVQCLFFRNHSSRIIESWARLPKPTKEETRKGNIQTIPKIEKIQVEEILSRMEGHNRPEFSQKNRMWNYPVFGQSILLSQNAKNQKGKRNTFRLSTNKAKWQVWQPQTDPLNRSQCSLFPRSDGEFKEIHPRNSRIQASNLRVRLFLWARSNYEELLPVSTPLLATENLWAFRKVILATEVRNHSFVMSTRRRTPKRQWHHRDILRLMQSR